MTFKEFLHLEGGMIPDEKAEEGKSKPKKPPIRGPSSVNVSGISGGPGGGNSGGGGPMPAPAVATKPTNG